MQILCAGGSGEFHEELCSAVATRQGCTDFLNNLIAPQNFSPPEGDKKKVPDRGPQNNKRSSKEIHNI